MVAAMATATTSPTVGPLLRTWRERRRMSQLELSTLAEVSTRHLSFVETGRSKPSRELLLHLAEHLEVPLRERNALLVAAGFAAAYQSASIDDPSMQQVRAAIDLVIGNHEPFPAVVLDRHWNLVLANAGAAAFLEGATAVLLRAPINVCRLTLHPEGLAKRLVNFGEVAAHLLGRVQRQVALTADDELALLLEEIAAYPGVSDHLGHPVSAEDPLLRLRLRSGSGELAFFSTIATFGSPHDVTLSELSIELFFPADEHTRAQLVS